MKTRNLILAIVFVAPILTGKITLAKDVTADQNLFSSQAVYRVKDAPTAQPGAGNMIKRANPIFHKEESKVLGTSYPREARESQPLGTSHGGGGLTINGKPVELYARNPNQLLGWNEVVEPLISKIKAKLPYFAELLEQEALKATWYSIPVRLVKLSYEKQGVPFIEYSQDIINNNGEIFIDSSIKRSAVSAGTLLFHEVLMNTLRNHSAYQGGRNSSDCHTLTRKLGVFLSQNVNQLSDVELIEGIQNLTPIFQRRDPDIFKGIREKAIGSFDTNHTEPRFEVLLGRSEIAAFKAREDSDNRKGGTVLLNQKKFDKELFDLIHQDCQTQLLFSSKIQSVERLQKESPANLMAIIKLTQKVKNHLDQVRLRTWSESEVIKHCDASQSCQWDEQLKLSYQGIEKQAAVEFINSIGFMTSTLGIGMDNLIDENERISLAENLSDEARKSDTQAHDFYFSDSKRDDTLVTEIVKDQNAKMAFLLMYTNERICRALAR